MAGIDKIDASMVKAVQENTLALAHASFDFSLVKIEAPIEYQALGRQLTQKRKTEAEFGQMHVTARKLALLFQGVIPKVPALVEAYGKRASEIASMPEINPKGTQKQHGAFAEYIGADGASIWASATSGNNAIAMHLLACMLARMWSPQESASIWVELVERRREQLRQQITENIANGTSYPTSDESALQVLMDRHHLSQWDASARSWLACADRAKAKQYQQLRLIVENLTLPVATSDDVYESVITAWPEALLAMNDLILGRPQRISNAAILLGMSAWHIYPPLIVIDDRITHVEHEDMLVSIGGTITVAPMSPPTASNKMKGGISLRDDTESVTEVKSKGVFWSLCLARMKHYGSPIRRTPQMSTDTSKVSPADFRFVVLGCILSHWSNEDCELSLVRRFLWHLVQAMARLSQYEREMIEWMAHLFDTALTLESATEPQSSTHRKLFALGKRQGKALLYSPLSPVSCTAFGLTRIVHGLSCQGSISALIEVTRTWASYAWPDDVLEDMVATIPNADGKGYIVFSVSPLHRADGKKPVTWTCDRLPPAKRPLMRLASRWKDKHASFGDGREYKRIYTFQNSSPTLWTRLVSVPENRDPAPLRQLLEWMDNGLIKTDDLVTRLAYASRTCASLQAQRVPRSFIDLEDRHVGNVLPEVCGGLALLHFAGKIFSTRPLAQWDLRSITLPGLRYILRDLRNAEHTALEVAFAMIAFLEFGICFPPTRFEYALAIAYENTIYVAAYLIKGLQAYKPDEVVEELPGSIAHPGVSVIISTADPLIRPASVETWHVINHDDFHGDESNNFDKGWLSMTPTGFEQRMDLADNVGYQDSNGTLIEARFALYDGKNWVADIDPTLAGSYINWTEADFTSHCSHTHEDSRAALATVQLASVRNWDEMIDSPQSNRIFVSAAHAQARMAALCLARQRSEECFVPLALHCWQCVADWTTVDVKKTRAPCSYLFHLKHLKGRFRMIPFRTASNNSMVLHLPRDLRDGVGSVPGYTSSDSIELKTQAPYILI